jgi:hypothetical protein
MPVVPFRFIEASSRPISAVPITLGKPRASRGIASGNQRRHPDAPGHDQLLRNISLLQTLLLTMASFVRPALLRQTCLASASTRAFSTKLAAGVSHSKPAASVLSRQAVRSAFAKDALPSSMRVAAFHAGGRQQILPPLPRKLDTSRPRAGTQLLTISQSPSRALVCILASDTSSSF